MATETQTRVEQLDAMLAGRGGLVLVGEFVKLGHREWGDPVKTDTLVNLDVNGTITQVRYRTDEDALDALGGSAPMLGTIVMLQVFAAAMAKDFVVYQGRKAR